MQRKRYKSWTMNFSQQIWAQLFKEDSKDVVPIIKDSRIKLRRGALSQVSKKLILEPAPKSVLRQKQIVCDENRRSKLSRQLSKKTNRSISSLENEISLKHKNLQNRLQQREFSGNLQSNLIKKKENRTPLNPIDLVITNGYLTKKNLSENTRESTSKIPLEEKSSVNLLLFSQSTPLHNVCKLSDGNIITLYKAAHFVKVCHRLTAVKDGCGCTPLQHACYTGKDINVISFLISANPSTCSIPDNEGRLPLHNACTRLNVDLDVISALVEAYPDAVLVKDRYDYTPIQYIELGLTTLKQSLV